MRLFLVILLWIGAGGARAASLDIPAPLLAAPPLNAPPLTTLGDRLPYASPQRERLWPLVREEAQRQGVPPALADAVAIVETGYTPESVGTSGEIGMMQVMPATARMLGFSGDMQGLFDPATNIHYGVTYLAHAWAASGGNACRALMKYRAGTGEDGFSPLSIQYCRRAAAWLRAQDPELARNVAGNTPLVANRSDGIGFSVNINGRTFHPDLTAMLEIADVPGAVAERPAAAAAPAVRGWHVAGRGRHIQAVIDAAVGDNDDGHVIHIGDPDQ